MSAQYNSEYSGSSVQKTGCGNYTNLNCYLGSQSNMAPIRYGTTSGVMVVPQFGTIGYDALTHGNSNGCGGHFTISNAYGNCNVPFSQRLCGGCNKN